MRRLPYLFFLLAIFFSSCKKDLLHFQTVQKLNTYTDSDRLNKIVFVTDQIGFVIGGERLTDAIILSTHDGGYTWQKNSFPIAGKGLYDMAVSPWGVLYAVGFDGKLLHSYDTGK